MDNRPDGKSGVPPSQYAQAVLLGTFGATDFAIALQITPQDANDRLKRLTDAGAICQQRVQLFERRGKEFVYMSIASLSGGDQSS